ncbi:hypothetical protein [Lacrimispora xylanisolvens]|uniref:hypothetical protein n=1 Tax=Lacrimispora xylanisolvens TaxID=384636 RepID=UPI002402A723
MFLYQIVNDHVRILTCRGYGGVVRVPEKIGNIPVTELAEYAFSNSEGRNEMLSHIGDGIQMCDEEGSPASYEEKDLPPEMTGDLLEDLYLPPSIRKIGNYAFYNCYKFRHLGVLQLHCGSGVRFVYRMSWNQKSGHSYYRWEPLLYAGYCIGAKAGTLCKLSYKEYDCKADIS